MFEVTDTQSRFVINLQAHDTKVFDFLEIGVGLAGFGIFFLFLGMLMLFDKSLLALGNVRPYQFTT